MWKAFQRYRALDPQARALFWRAAFLLPCVALSLRVYGFIRTRNIFQKQIGRRPASRPDDHPEQIVFRTCRMVKAAGHYGMLHPTCLAESLALYYLLQRQGVSADLRIGVRKTSDEFEAHAWVEYAGAALNQPDDQHRHYAAFDRGFSDQPGDPL
ncbi:MAG TPA: lasso peptide biosynthesis B2 protein [Verrucomicrobiae bacterium]|nr:lasso peptide biosynthesis B2 protein [Verrucomicrobiae bacterium]